MKRPNPHRTVRLLLLLTLFASLGLLAAAPTASSQAAGQEAGRSAGAEAVRVFLVRHAEKAQDDPADPILTAAGERRAAALARLLAAAEVTHLFSTDLKRTRATVAPLVAARGLTVATYDGGDLPALAARLRALPAGSVAVVAGHSNTTPGLYAELGAGKAQGLVEHPRYGWMIPDADYDRLYEVVLVRDEAGAPLCASGLELRYGE